MIRHVQILPTSNNFENYYLKKEDRNFIFIVDIYF